MTTSTPARTLRHLCADWLVSNADREPDRVLRNIAQDAADHIAAAYPATLAPLVGDPAQWTAFPEGRIDGFDGYQPDLALAYLGDNTWLHLSGWVDTERQHRLLLVIPCGLHGGYRTLAVQHLKPLAERAGMGTSNWLPGDDEDLAELLADLDQTPCPGDCGSVGRPESSPFGGSLL